MEYEYVESKPIATKDLALRDTGKGDNHLYGRLLLE